MSLPRHLWVYPDIYEFPSIVKQKYDTAIVPEISVNSSYFTRGNNYKLLNQTFSTTYGSIHLHLGILVVNIWNTVVYQMKLLMLTLL